MYCWKRELIIAYAINFGSIQYVSFVRIRRNKSCANMSRDQFWGWPEIFNDIIECPGNIINFAHVFLVIPQEFQSQVLNCVIFIENRKLVEIVKFR